MSLILEQLRQRHEKPRSIGKDDIDGFPLFQK